MAKSYDVTAMPHAGFETYRRAGRAFGNKAPTTVTVRTDFKGEDAFERVAIDARRRHALGVRDAEKRYEGESLLLEDARKHLDMVLEDELEAARVQVLGDGEVTERQLEEMLQDQRLRVTPVKGHAHATTDDKKAPAKTDK